jgi:thiamine transporter ThiT
MCAIAPINILLNYLLGLPLLRLAALFLVLIPFHSLGAGTYSAWLYRSPSIHRHFLHPGIFVIACVWYPVCAPYGVASDIYSDVYQSRCCLELGLVRHR